MRGSKTQLRPTVAELARFALSTLPARSVLIGLLVLCATLDPGSAAAKEYVAFGDSITEGTGDDDPVVGYPARLQALLQAAGNADTVRNEGLGGEKTVGGLTRLNQVLDAGGDVLLLMEGSNDISTKVSRETTVFNLTEMAKKAETKGLEVVHATVIPRTPQARVDSENLLNQRLNEEIRHLAGAKQRQLVDNFEVFGSNPNWFEALYWKQPTDFVGHPNADGYDVMAQAFFDVLTGIDSVPPVTGLLTPWNGQNNVKPSSEISVEVWDFGAGIDTSSAQLTIDGELVAAEVTGGARRTQLRYNSERPLRGVVHVGLQVSDLASPAHSINREVSKFIIAGTQFIDGDIDRDGRVDGVDLVLLSRAFATSTGSPRYDGSADLDNDGTIDGADLAILASHFGEQL